MSNKDYSSQFGFKAIMVYKNNNYSLAELCSKYGISDITLYGWIKKYEDYGMVSGFKNLKIIFQRIKGSDRKRLFIWRIPMAINNFLDKQSSCLIHI